MCTPFLLVKWTKASHENESTFLVVFTYLTKGSIKMQGHWAVTLENGSQIILGILKVTRHKLQIFLRINIIL